MVEVRVPQNWRVCFESFEGVLHLLSIRSSQAPFSWIYLKEEGYSGEIVEVCCGTVMMTLENDVHER